MTPQIKKEIVATLLKAGRRDLAKIVAAPDSYDKFVQALKDAWKAHRGVKEADVAKRGVEKEFNSLSTQFMRLFNQGQPRL